VATLLRWAATIRGGKACATPRRGSPRLRRMVLRALARIPKPISTHLRRRSEGYDDMVVAEGHPLRSHCEHHLATHIGASMSAICPAGAWWAFPKLARVVEALCRRLQVQEKMNAQIANTIQKVLKPKGVAVVIEAAHQCMTTRGVAQDRRHHGDFDHAGRLPRKRRGRGREFLGRDRQSRQAATTVKAFHERAGSGQNAHRTSTPPAAAPTHADRVRARAFGKNPAPAAASPLTKAARRPTSLPVSALKAMAALCSPVTTDVVPVDGQDWSSDPFQRKYARENCTAAAPAT